MQEESSADAQSDGRIERQPAVHQEHQVEEEEGEAELDQDLSWNISQEFAEKGWVCSNLTELCRENYYYKIIYLNRNFRFK